MTTALETTPFDPAAFIDTPDAQAELISDALESGDAAYIANAFATVARARGMAQVARDAGISREGLYKALGGNGDPRLSTLLGITRALGIKLVARSAV
jgi:probable addiction module antidote protein